MTKSIEVSANPVIHTASAPTFTAGGALVQFVATPGQTRSRVCVLRGGVPPGLVVPLHTHDDLEILYVLAGSLEVFQGDGDSGTWQTLLEGDLVTIAGGVKHAVRNTSSGPASTLVVTGERLHAFFRELAEPLDPNTAVPPAPEDLTRLVEASARYGYWLGSPSENAAIGIILPQ